MFNFDSLQHTSIYQQAIDDSDSDGEEGGMGNVNRMIMRPPGHSGKAKRGHLCFDAAFETGNLGRVDLVNEHEYDLYIRPDTCCPKLRLWFNFTVDNVRLNQRVVFNIINISKAYNLFGLGGTLVPIVRSTSRFKWQRIPKRFVFYQRSRMHHHHHVLSFAFLFDKEDELYQFALSFPYSYNRCQTFLNNLEAKTLELGDMFKRECIANSIQKRKVDMLLIGNSKGLDGSAKRRIIVIIARSHPGESPTSYVCQGLIELLISSHLIASQLREHVMFIIIPMLNPDGVYLGNYRSTNIGADLNRMWHRASPFTHPALTAIINYLTDYNKNKEFQIDFVIDIHANPSCLGSFIYGNCYDDVYRNERHALFPKLLGNVADDFDSKNCMYNTCGSKIGTARRFFCANLNQKLNAYSYEVSFNGYKLKGLDGIIPYTEDSYKRCGRNLIKALLEYYHLTEVIQATLYINPKDKKRRKLRKIRERPCHISSSRSSHTTRIAAPIHLKEIGIYYDSDTSLDEVHVPQRSPKSMKKKSAASEVPMSPIIMVLPPSEPCLSIIDFNMITEHELKMLTSTSTGF